MEFSNIKRLWWEVIVGICIVIFTVAAAIKLFSGDIKFSVDAPTLLSILLALFSVALSALFYFKATESSSMFYDNTYKYTTDISQMLVKMDSGFGEKFKVLETGYADIKVYLRSPPKVSTEIDEATAQIKIEKESLEKAVEEKDNIIKDFLNNSSVEQADKDRVLSELEEKNTQIRQLTEEMARLNDLKNIELSRRKKPSGIFFDSDMDFDFGVPSRVLQHTKVIVIKKLGGAPFVLKANLRSLDSEFVRNIGSFNDSYLSDLEKLGYLDEDGLTSEGTVFLKSVAQTMIKSPTRV